MWLIGAPYFMGSAFLFILFILFIVHLLISLLHGNSLYFILIYKVLPQRCCIILLGGLKVVAGCACICLNLWGANFSWPQALFAL